MSRSKLFIIIIGFALSGLFAAFTLRAINFEDLLNSLQSVNKKILSLVLISKFLTFVFLSWRMQILLKNLVKINFTTAFKSILFGFTGNNILPLRIGELLKIEYIARNSKKNLTRSSCFAVLAVERTLDLFMLLVLAVITFASIITDLKPADTFYIFLGIFTISIATVFFTAKRPDTVLLIFSKILNLFGSRIKTIFFPVIEKFVNSFKAILSTKVLLLALLNTMGYWTVSAFSFELYIWAFSLHIPIWAPIILIVFVSIGVIIPSVPGNIGTYHFFLQSGLIYLGITASTATSFSIIAHAMSTVPFTITGILIFYKELFSKGYIHDQKTAESN